MEKNINNIFIKLLIGVRFLWNVSMGLLLSVFLTFSDVLQIEKIVYLYIFSGYFLLGIFFIIATFIYLKDVDKGYFQISYIISNLIILLLPLSVLIT